MHLFTEWRERGGNDTESNKTWRERKKGKRGEKEEKVLPGGGRKYIHNLIQLSSFFFSFLLNATESWVGG